MSHQQPNHVQSPNPNQHPQLMKGHMAYRANIPQPHDIDMFVKSYLEKRGYKKLSESEYTKDSKSALENIACKLLLQGEINMSNYITFWNGNEKFPYHTIQCYKELRDWIYKNVEANKRELLPIIYPIFIHTYIDLVVQGHETSAAEFMLKFKDEHMSEHGEEIQKLLSTSQDKLLQENEVAQLFRNYKYVVRVSSQTFELLFSYLQDRNFMSIINILNQYTNLKVYSKYPSYYYSTDQMYNENLPKTTHWGVLEEDKKEEEKIEEPLSPTSEEDAMDVEQIDSRKRRKDNKKKAPKTTKKKKKEEDEESVEISISSVVLTEEADMDSFNELRNQLNSNYTSTPLVKFYSIYNPTNTLNTCSVSYDNSLIACGYEDSSIKVWDIMGTRKKVYKASKDILDTSGNFRLSKQHYFELVGHSQSVFGLNFSADNKYLLSSSADGSARLWSMDTMEPLVCYKGHSFPVWSASFSRLGYYFATASYDRTARLWSTDNIHPLRVFAGHLGDVNTVNFHPNCNYLITGSSDKCIRFWEVHTGECVRILTGHYLPIHCSLVLPDGSMAISAGEDKDIFVWDIRCGKKIHQLKGHNGAIWSLDVNKEGNYIASGSSDCSIKLWDLRMMGEKEEEGTYFNGKDPCLETFKSRKTPVYNVTFSSRNLLLASGPCEVKED